MIIDTHVHYNLEPLFSNEQDPSHWRTLLDQAVAASVSQGIIVGTDTWTSKLAAHLASKTAAYGASIGCHPNLYHETYVEAVIQKRLLPQALESDIAADMRSLSKLVQGERIVAIGETGLDYFRLPSDGEEREMVIEMQKRAFVEHIQLARSHQRTLICHVRDSQGADQKKEGNAYWDAVEILEKYHPLPFVLHCASGPLEYIDQAVTLGAYFGFDGNMTYPSAGHIRAIFQRVPIERRLVETDAPYLPPQAFRGKICEPAMIVQTVEYIEKEYNIDRSVFVENAYAAFPRLQTLSVS